MATDPHRVTAQHIHGLAVSDRMRAGATILADTDDGIRYVNPGAVFNSEAKVRRLLMTRSDLAEDAAASGMSMTEFLRANAGRIAAELNAVPAEKETR